MPGVFSKEKVAAVEDPYEDLFANYERKDAIRYKKPVRALTKKDGVFMKLASKQFDQSNATKVKRRGKERIPAPRMTVTNTTPWSPRSDDSYVDPYETDHEAEYDPDEEEEDVVDPPWSPRRDDYEIDDGDKCVSDDDENEERDRDAAEYFGPLY